MSLMFKVLPQNKRTMGVSMHLAPDNCKAAMFGLYYLVRDVFVSMAALGGAFLWQISPETNFVTAFVYGVIGTIGFSLFGRDVRTKNTTGSVG
jgi:hypothetical protein